MGRKEEDEKRKGKGGIAGEGKLGESNRGWWE